MNNVEEPVFTRVSLVSCCKQPTCAKSSRLNPTLSAKTLPNALVQPAETPTGCASASQCPGCVPAWPYPNVSGIGQGDPSLRILPST